MAVAPMLVSQSTRWIASRAVTSPARVSAKASNSWPRVMGTASWSWVRPILRIGENSLPLARKAAISSFIAATSCDVAERHADVRARSGRRRSWTASS